MTLEQPKKKNKKENIYKKKRNNNYKSSVMGLTYVNYMGYERYPGCPDIPPWGIFKGSPLPPTFCTFPQNFRATSGFGWGQWDFEAKIPFFSERTKSVVFLPIF